MANQDSIKQKGRTAVDAFTEKVGDMPELTKEAAEALLKVDKINLMKRAASGKSLTREERRIVSDIAGTDDVVALAKDKVELAATLKTTRITLDKALKRMKADGLLNHRKPNGMWDVHLVRTYMRRNGIGNIPDDGAEEAGSLGEFDRLKIELLLTKVEDAKIDLEVKRGTLTTIKEFELQIAEAFGVIKHYLLSRWDALAVQLAGHPVPEIKRRGKANDLDILHQFATRDWPESTKDMLRRYLLWYEAENSRKNTKP